MNFNFITRFLVGLFFFNVFANDPIMFMARKYLDRSAIEEQRNNELAELYNIFWSGIQRLNNFRSGEEALRVNIQARRDDEINILYDLYAYQTGPISYLLIKEKMERFEMQAESLEALNTLGSLFLETKRTLVRMAFTPQLTYILSKGQYSWFKALEESGRNLVAADERRAFHYLVQDIKQERASILERQNIIDRENLQRQAVINREQNIRSSLQQDLRLALEFVFSKDPRKRAIFRCYQDGDETLLLLEISEYTVSSSSDSSRNLLQVFNSGDLLIYFNNSAF
jgi:hypothetical protein